MKRLLVSMIGFMAALMLLPAGAQTYSAGTDYALINPPVATDVPVGKVEVVELFWYGCPHCYDLEPYVRSWLKTKPASIELVRMPAIFSNPRWQLHARAFYTADALGVVERIHQPLFDAIHKANRKLDSERALAEFFAEQGVERQRFDDAFNSFAVDMKVRRAADMTRRYGIDGVPVFIVAGKYRVTGSMAKSYENMLRIVEHLAAKEAAAQP